MNTAMKILLSSEAAPAVWGESAPVSFDGSTATIHVQKAPLPAIQRAARKLDGMGVGSVALAGDGWDTDACFAFWQGYFNPKKQQAAAPEKQQSIEFPALAEAAQAELDARIKAAAWVRWVTNCPAEQIYPQTLCESAAELLHGLAPEAVSSKVLLGDELLAESFVGIHTVGRGSVRAPAMLQLDYNPTGDANAPVAVSLVGKGITFDSGGYSIKPSVGMVHMKSDMGGAAMVTGGLALAIQRGLDKRVKLFLCCAENMVSSNAFKLGDILNYRNGVTVEVKNTDAEGRLVLADGLIAAAEDEPGMIVDAATLTGAAKMAVGRDYNSLMTFSDDLAGKVLAAAGAEDEKLWRLPLEALHLGQIGSPFADIANIGAEGTAGASTAAAFLAKFVPETQRESAWLHLDLSGSYQPGATDLWAAGAKGHGVRTIARLLADA